LAELAAVQAPEVPLSLHTVGMRAWVRLKELTADKQRRRLRRNIGQQPDRSNVVELHFLGKVTDGGNSPTLFATPEIMYGREIYVLQGWKITDPQTLAALGTPDDEAVIAVPRELMRYLPEEDRGAAD
jgi:hypothetical protein